MIKLGELFGTTPHGKLQSSDFINLTALSNRSGVVALEDGTRLVRIDYSIAAQIDYAFDVAIVEGSGNPILPTRLGNKAPILTSATIAFAEPEPTKCLGLSCTAIRLLIRRRVTSIRNSL